MTKHTIIKSWCCIFLIMFVGFAVIAAITDDMYMIRGFGTIGAVLVLLTCPVCLLDAKLGKKYETPSYKASDEPIPHPYREQLALQQAQLDLEKEKLEIERKKLQTIELKSQREDYEEKKKIALQKAKGVKRFCQDCGSRVDLDAIICPFCGIKL